MGIDKVYHNYVEHNSSISDHTSTTKKSGALDNLKNIEKYLSGLVKNKVGNTDLIFKGLADQAKEIKESFILRADGRKLGYNFVQKIFSKVHEMRIKAVYNNIVKMREDNSYLRDEKSIVGRRDVDLSKVFNEFIKPAVKSEIDNLSRVEPLSLAKQYGYVKSDSKDGNENSFIKKLEAGVKELEKLGFDLEKLKDPSEEPPTSEESSTSERPPLEEHLKNLSEPKNLITIKNVLHQMYNRSNVSNFAFGEDRPFRKPNEIKDEFPNIIFLLKALAFAGRDVEKIKKNNEDIGVDHVKNGLYGLKSAIRFPPEARASAVELLLQRGLDPNVLLSSGESLLNLAKRQKDEALVEVLFKYGADPEWMIKGNTTQISNQGDDKISQLFKQASNIFDQKTK